MKLSGRTDQPSITWAGKGVLASASGEAVIRYVDFRDQDYSVSKLLFMILIELCGCHFRIVVPFTCRRLQYPFCNLSVFCYYFLSFLFPQVVGPGAQRQLRAELGRTQQL